MTYNPEIHHRSSIRLKGYDYSQNGLYFITICVKDRQKSFGIIKDGKMLLNEIGEKANEYWLEIPKHFSVAVLHEHIIMPNHVHGIIELVETPRTLCSRDITCDVPTTTVGNTFGKPIRGSVSVIIQQFKSSVKRWCNKNRYEYFCWQPRFHDHIIRNENAYKKISEYILNNPVNWSEDKFNMEYKYGISV